MSQELEWAEDGGEQQSSLGRCGTSWTRTGGEGEIGASGKQRKSSLHRTSEMLEVAWEHPLCPGTSAKAQLLSQISTEKQQKQSSISASVALPVMGSAGTGA